MKAVAEQRFQSFGEVVAASHSRGELLVQPRMGFADPAQMRHGLIATRDARAATIGTITLDSYTRTGDHRAVRQALASGAHLNGYPIVDLDPATTAAMLSGVLTPTFPVQVRHGSADPTKIVQAMLKCALSASEGGPVSYSLPYSKTPLTTAVDNWRRCCETLAAAREPGFEPHLETFGGCMMGQLCPPAILVALSLLEGLFFWQHGIRCISFSYAQQTHLGQDEEAVAALKCLVARHLPYARAHVVIYTYMGVYPRTPAGALRLLGESARLAARVGASRLIVKTTAEAHRLPTVAENVAALEYAWNAAKGVPPCLADADTGIGAQAAALVDNVLALHDDIGDALITAFSRGYLDVPFCLHPDNRGQTRSYLDRDGRLEWGRIGALPISELVEQRAAPPMTSADLLGALHYVQRKFDHEASGTGRLLSASTAVNRSIADSGQSR